ncbi:hypothetical protein HZS_6404 [Henneguya salminicola]|nr:hypothetical protein HZS_6404 [Henneguya salminicola]
MISAEIIDELNLYVNDLIAFHEERFSNEYLIEQQESMEIPYKTIMEECDPNRERISQVRRAREKETACYKELFN